MYDYQRNNIYFAQAAGMMESICEQELIQLGAKNTKVAYRGVYFNADTPALYKINYLSRTITRVLAPLRNFHCKTSKDIMKAAMSIEWNSFFSVEQTFAITSSVNKSTINNSLYASQVLKDGIADFFRTKYEKRPNVDTVNPDIRFNLFIEKDKAILSLDIR